MTSKYKTNVKKVKALFFMIFFTFITIIGISIFVNILNSDLYGRLIETKNIDAPRNINPEEIPEVTLVLHKFLNDENAIEASIFINIQRTSMFEKFGNKIKIISFVTDGYNYDPHGAINHLVLKDSIDRDSNGYVYYALESNRFIIPVAPSLNGFPFDDIRIQPMVSLSLNDNYSQFNFNVQKRIPGRILITNSKESKIQLTRTPTEKYFVIISSLIFLILTFIITYGLFTTTKGLNTIEELVAVAGYLIAIAGFRELIGVSRNNGIGTLEIVVILIPLLCIFSGIIYSFWKGKTAIDEVIN